MGLAGSPCLEQSLRPVLFEQRVHQRMLRLVSRLRARRRSRSERRVLPPVFIQKSSHPGRRERRHYRSARVVVLAGHRVFPLARSALAAFAQRAARYPAGAVYLYSIRSGGSNDTESLGQPGGSRGGPYVIELLSELPAPTAGAGPETRQGVAPVSNLARTPSGGLARSRPVTEIATHDFPKSGKPGGASAGLLGF